MNHVVSEEKKTVSEHTVHREINKLNNKFEKWVGASGYAHFYVKFSCFAKIFVDLTLDFINKRFVRTNNTK